MKKIVLSVLLLLSYFGIASAQGISSDGRDFYLGFLYPSFNSTNAYSPYGNVLGFFGVYALISSYTDNQVTVSYFNLNTGAEEEIQSYNIMARRTVQVVLDINHMKEDPDGEQIEWRACHITAKKPVTITYFSTGSCSGGTYLALPTSTLGKEYVVESYHDNVGGIGGELSNEDAAGYFEIIAPYDGTTVQITAASTTRGNHRGVNCGVGAGTPAPWTISLNRGQTYMVKSAANDPNCSISGSTVVSDKPVAVIAGHENAITDGSDINPDSGRIDARNFMIEQMIPVQYWDSTGYVSIPLWNSIPDSTRGKGDEYDFFSSIIPGVNSNALGDTILATVLPASAQTIIASPYMEPEPRMLSVREPIEAHSLTSKKIHVVQYGQRAFSPGVPLPAPSQMSIIPMSLWRHSYLMFVPSNTFENFAGYYINVICDKNDFNQNHIHLAQNAGTLGQLVSGNVMLKKKNDSIPNFPNLMGVTLALSPGAYYLTGDSLSKPFMVYYYGFRALDPTRDLGSNNGDDFYFSYASPGGLNVSGNGGSLSVTVDTLCAKWHVCVHDGRKSGAGIKSIQLLVDPAGDFTKPTQVYNNVQFDPANYDVATPYLNEIDLPGSDTSYCFDVLVKNPLLTAYGPIYVVDNAGNATIVTLNYTAPNLKLMFKPSYANGVDTLIFPHTLPNKDTCATVYYYNSGKPTDPALQINAVSLRAHDASFSITNVSPAPPVSLKPGDTM
ncbi:MAG TPA: IgGFc-binding protein, partial [Candidatus Kapabacteria bacterium]|nr:IgGFc-binding protein [Candidatus Kapabacteria bacterium]